jgi:hypothetical protein
MKYRSLQPKNKDMFSFRFPFPQYIKPFLKKNNIYSENDLIEFIEREQEKRSIVEFGGILWRRKEMKATFLLYQRCKNNGEQPFLLNFSPNARYRFLKSGILDENQLKEYSLNYTVDTLISKQFPQYKFLRELIKDEKFALDHFFDHFTDKTTRLLKRYDVYNSDELKYFIEKTKLKVKGLGPRGKEEIMKLWDAHFSKI